MANHWLKGDPITDDLIVKKVDIFVEEQNKKLEIAKNDVYGEWQLEIVAKPGEKATYIPDVVINLPHYEFLLTLEVRCENIHNRLIDPNNISFFTWLETALDRHVTTTGVLWRWVDEEPKEVWVLKDMALASIENEDDAIILHLTYSYLKINTCVEEYVKSLARSKSKN